MCDAAAFYRCRCIFTDNIFIKDYNLHVRFTSERQFRAEYQKVLRSLGCTTDAQLDAVFEGMRAEVHRRRSLSVDSAERTAAIREQYKPLHSHVYKLQEADLAPEFLQAVKYCLNSYATKEGLLKLIETEAAPRVYRFPVFTKEFCRDLTEELEHFEQSGAPRGKPNTMNNYGILLDELGFDEGLISHLRELYLSPITSLLYPDCGGKQLDSHKAFVVKYAMHEDLDLTYHYDNAEVTLNVSLGKDFIDGNLYFGDMRQVPLSEAECVEVEHHVSQGVLHRGQQMHGALPISAGVRWNLIVWMRSSQERNKMCPMCSKKPTLVESRGFADGFTASGQGQNASCILE